MSQEFVYKDKLPILFAIRVTKLCALSTYSKSFLLLKNNPCPFLFFHT